MYQTICRYCGTRQIPSLDASLAKCFICRGPCEKQYICPSCFGPQPTPQSKKSSDQCIHCVEKMPKLKDWFSARIAARYLDKSSYDWKGVLKELSEKTLLMKRQMDKLVNQQNRISVLDSLTSFPFYKYYPLLDLIKCLPVPPEEFSKWVKTTMPYPAKSDQVHLKRFFVEADTNWQGWLASWGLIQQGFVNDDITHSFEMGLNWELGFNVMTATQMITWYLLPGLRKNPFRSIPSDKLLAIFNGIKHPFLGDWSTLVLCQTLKHDRKRLVGVPDLVPLLKGQRSLMTGLKRKMGTPTNQQKSLHEKKNFQIAAAIALGDEKTLFKILKRSGDSQYLPSKLLNTTEHLPPKVVNHLLDTGVQYWKRQSSETQESILSELLKTSDENNWQKLFHLTVKSRGKARGKLLTRLLGKRFNSKSSSLRMRLEVAKSLGDAIQKKFITEQSELLQWLNWLVEDEQDETSKEITPVVQLVCKRIWENGKQSLTTRDSLMASGSFKTWLSIVCRFELIDLSQWFKSLRWPELKGLVSSLCEVEEKSRQCLNRPGVTNKALLSFLSMSSARTDIDCQWIRDSWVNKLIEGRSRDSVLKDLERLLFSRGSNRPFILVMAWDAVDAINNRFAQRGRVLLKREDLDSMCRLDFSISFSLLKKLLSEDSGDDYISLSKATLRLVNKSVHHGEMKIIPLVKLLSSMAFERIERDSSWSEGRKVFELVRREWPKLEARLISDGGMVKGEYFASTVLDEIADFERRVPAVTPVSPKSSEKQASKRRQTKPSTIEDQATANANRAVLMARFQAEVTELMSRTNLSPAEKSDRMQILSLRFQSKMKKTGTD